MERLSADSIGRVMENRLREVMGEKYAMKKLLFTVYLDKYYCLDAEILLSHKYGMYFST